MFYLIDAKDMKVTGKFTYDLRADEVGQETLKGNYVVISNVAQLEQFPVKKLLILRVSCGLPEVASVKGTKADECGRIWDAIKEMELDLDEKDTGKASAKQKAATKKAPAKPRLGKYLKDRIEEGAYTGFTAQQILDEVKETEIDARDAEKDVIDCCKWYARALRKKGKDVPEMQYEKDLYAEKEAKKAEKAAEKKRKAEEKAKKDAEKKAAEEAEAKKKAAESGEDGNDGIMD